MCLLRRQARHGDFVYSPVLDLPDPISRATLTSSDMFLIVHRLCSHDPHQFFQRLETLTREYLLEVKVRLLEQLSLGYSTIPLAIKFIQMLVNEYSSLCKALPSLLLLLQPLVSALGGVGVGVGWLDGWACFFMCGSGGGFKSACVCLCVGMCFPKRKWLNCVHVCLLLMMCISVRMWACMYECVWECVWISLINLLLLIGQKVNAPFKL